MTEDYELANDFLFIGDWTIRSDSAWSKKKIKVGKVCEGSCVRRAMWEMICV